ncbi:hypothetical protein ACFWAY_25030 [Rhodococcus sp. NPDC059968]|uniref:hypothetical protein n=1 Tax=Rhodococcus sp. NPDC059968 TaxID=3347017 RepID=UPI00366C0841
MEFSVLVYGQIEHFEPGHTASVDAAGNLHVLDHHRQVVRTCEAGSWILLPGQTRQHLAEPAVSASR